MNTLVGFLFSASLLLSSSCEKLSDSGFELSPDGQQELEETLSSDQDALYRSLTIGIIGDSISSFKGYLASDIPGYDGASYQSYYPNGNVDKVEKTWWYKTADLLRVSPDSLSNCSWSGSRVSGNSLSETSAQAGCSTRRIMDLSSRGFDPDVVLCFISCNDWANNVPIGNWSVSNSFSNSGNIQTLREAYALMIVKIQERYPDSEIFCMTNLVDKKRDRTLGWPSNNSSGITVEEWNKHIVDVAEALGCRIINLQECGIDYDNVDSYTVDGGLHPNESGMALIAEKVSSVICSVLFEE